MSVVDNRTGKKYELKLDDHGLLKANDLKQITAGGDGLGLRTYDPGYGLPTTDIVSVLGSFVCVCANSRHSIARTCRPGFPVIGDVSKPLQPQNHKCF